MQVRTGGGASIRFADKVLQRDFIQTDPGFPVSFRQDHCFVGVAACRKQFHFKTAPLTFVIDRARSGLETVKNRMANPGKACFMTGEKTTLARVSKLSTGQGITVATNRETQARTDDVLILITAMKGGRNRRPSVV